MVEVEERVVEQALDATFLFPDAISYLLGWPTERCELIRLENPEVFMLNLQVTCCFDLLDKLPLGRKWRGQVTLRVVVRIQIQILVLVI